MSEATSVYAEMSLIEKNEENIDLVNEHLSSNRDRAYANAQSSIAKLFEQLQTTVDDRKRLLLDELKRTYEQSQLEDLDVEFDSSTSFDLARLVETYGRVVTRSRARPIDETSFKITGRGLRSCTVHEEATFTLSLKDKQSMLEQTSNACPLLDIYIITSSAETEQPEPVNKSVRARNKQTKPAKTPLKSSDNPNKCNCECKMECLGDGLYEVRYKLDRKGVYSLNVLVNKKHISGSPFKLACLEGAPLPVRSMSRVSSAPKKSPVTRQPPVKSHSSLNLKQTSASPGRIGSAKASTDDKKLAVAAQKPVAGMLKKCKSPSSFSLLASPPPKSLVLLSSPTSTSSGSNTVKSSSVCLAEKQQSSTLECGSHSPSAPLSAHEDSLMSSAHSMAGSDMSSPLSPALSRINISNIENFNDLTENKKEDDFLFQIGRRGRAVSEFMNPQAVCATGEYIYVTDSNNQKIEAFGHNGEYKFSLGWNGTNVASKIRRPIGIDCKADGKILVVDYEFKCVNVYEETGKFVTRICQNRLLGNNYLATRFRFLPS
jgi:hypothetical protein